MSPRTFSCQSAVQNAASAQLLYGARVGKQIAMRFAILSALQAVVASFSVVGTVRPQPHIAACSHAAPHMVLALPRTATPHMVLASALNAGKVLCSEGVNLASLKALVLSITRAQFAIAAAVYLAVRIVMRKRKAAKEQRLLEEEKKKSSDVVGAFAALGGALAGAAAEVAQEVAAAVKVDEEVKSSEVADEQQGGAEDETEGVNAYGNGNDGGDDNDNNGGAGDGAPATATQDTTVKETKARKLLKKYAMAQTGKAQRTTVDERKAEAKSEAKAGADSWMPTLDFDFGRNLIVEREKEEVKAARQREREERQAARDAKEAKRQADKAKAKANKPFRGRNRLSERNTKADNKWLY